MTEPMAGLRCLSNPTHTMTLLSWPRGGDAVCWVRGGAFLSGMPEILKERARLADVPQVLLRSRRSSLMGSVLAADMSQAFLTQAQDVLKVPMHSILPVFSGPVRELEPLAPFVEDLKALQPINPQEEPYWWTIPMVCHGGTFTFGALVDTDSTFGTSLVLVTSLTLKRKTLMRLRDRLAPRFASVLKAEGVHSPADQLVLVTTNLDLHAEAESLTQLAWEQLIDGVHRRRHEGQTQWRMMGLDDVRHFEPLSEALTRRANAILNASSFEAWCAQWWAYFNEVPWTDGGEKAITLKTDDTLWFRQGRWVKDARAMWEKCRPSTYTVDWGRGPEQLPIWIHEGNKA